MRQLTPKEIENAPDWATHYVIPGGIGVIRYRNNTHFVWADTGVKQPLGEWRKSQCKPIPR
jgi:hypothetical protein